MILEVEEAMETRVVALENPEAAMEMNLAAWAQEITIVPETPIHLPEEIPIPVDQAAEGVVATPALQAETPTPQTQEDMVVAAVVAIAAIMIEVVILINPAEEVMMMHHHLAAAADTMINLHVMVSAFCLIEFIVKRKWRI